MDEPRPRGLSVEVARLIILCFAEQTGRTFRLRGAAYPASLENMMDEAELVEQPLPSEADWTAAIEVAASVMGIAVPPLRNTTNVEKLTEEVLGIVTVHRRACSELPAALRSRLATWSQQPAPARLRTAETVTGLLETLARVQPGEVVETLASAAIETSREAMGSSLKKADGVVRALAETRWELFEAVRQIEDERKPPAQAVLSGVAASLEADELASGIALALRDSEKAATRLLVLPPPPPPMPPKPSRPPEGPEVWPPPPPPAPEMRVVSEGRKTLRGRKQARQALEEVAEKLPTGDRWELELTWRILDRRS